MSRRQTARSRTALADDVHAVLVSALAEALVLDYLQPGHGPAPTTEETPALLLGRPSGGLWMQRGRLVSEDHCTPMAPRVCRKPGPQQVGLPE